ncbi:MAG: leucine-rich repeat protein [Verrucomicrobia bacterium]|nr:leucine-rich repeat protein [Verrucomicrobiota bacterium]
MQAQFDYKVENGSVTITRYTGPGGAVTIPDTVQGLPVTSIGDGAFNGYTGLTSVVIPNSVISIGFGAFQNCSSLTGVTIPDSVTKIGPRSFQDCTRMKNLTIGRSLANIDEEAFAGCRALTSIVIPDSVTHIRNFAFAGCSSLVNLTLGSNLSHIGVWAFAGCAQLVSIAIPDSVTTIYGGAFAGCTSLNEFIVSAEHPVYCSLEGIMFTKSRAKLKAYPAGKTGSYTIPTTVTSIEFEAFSGCSRLTAVVIPETVTSVGGGAFLNCVALTSITIPNTVTSIGEFAFSSCTGLTSIVVPGGVTSIERYTFSGCTGLRGITLGGGVTSIGDRAFYGCSGLTSITIPDRVTSIGDQAFYGCTGLSNLTIPEGVTSIGQGTFYGCRGLTSIMIPDRVTSIGDQAFYGCTRLTNLTIPEGVTSIGREAFCGCSGLTSLVIPDRVTWIGDSAFYGCSGLTSLVIPDRVTWIGDSAFSGCSGLTSITIPDSVTSIGSSAFSGCSGLTSVVIGGSLTSIGGWAFEGCLGLNSIEVGSNNATYSSLDGVLFDKGRTLLVWFPRGRRGDYTIPANVTNIGQGAFSGCSGLTNLSIPDSVTSIGQGAFSGCSGLRSVYFYGNAPGEDAGEVFAGCPRATVYYLPETTGWGPTFGGRPTVLGHGAAALEIALHPAIRVTGEVGSTYVIESKAEVEGDFWLTRGWIELATPTATWTDPLPTTSPRNVYRAVKVTKPVVQTIPNIVWIPPGRFTMGSPEGERGRQGWEGPQTRVELTQGFWMGKYEVTVGEYFAVMGQVENPGELDRPVQGVSGDDAVAYCQKLTEQERAAGRLPTGFGYRLPTEAEWEYACRAGTTTRFSFGDALECDDGCEYCPLLDEHMWWCGNSGGRTQAVGSKLPNAWGLYDMHGNVMEWCQDLFGWDWEQPGYPGGIVVDPQGPSEGSYRVRGGGYWSVWTMHDGYGLNCRSAYRGSYSPSGNSYGFRVVLAPGQ